MTRRNQHYPSELRERAVRMVFEVTPNYGSGPKNSPVSEWSCAAAADRLGRR